MQNHTFLQETINSIEQNSVLPQRVNNAYQMRNVLGSNTLYLNWGLWNSTIVDMDEAACELVLHLGRMAGIGSQTSLLDVGFGFGDQLLDWCRHASLQNAQGINICPEQTEIARIRLEQEGFAERVSVQCGDAVQLPFSAASFDVVTAVECAFHFRSRGEFFSEAKRVLKNGGCLVLADFINTEQAPGKLQKLAQRLAVHYWGFAPNSFCSAEEYAAILTQCGFHEVRIEKVTESVIPPGMSYARRKIWSSDLWRRMSFGAWFTTMAALALSGLLSDPLPGEYVFVRAQC